MDSSLSGVAIVLGLCVLSVIGDYFLKRASEQEMSLLSGWFFLGLAMYGLTAVGWAYALKSLKFVTIGPIYAVGTIALLALVGVVFFGEKLRWQEVAGIILGLSSVGLLARFA